MSFRSESKGSSLSRGQRLRTFSSSKPKSSPRRTRAVSVGSPISPFSFTVASLHSRAARSRGSWTGSWKSASWAGMIRPPTYSWRTVILFWVRVPVLSEQMTDTLPSPSTACNLRMMACSLAIFRVPKESTMVTMELRASGMAATARAMAKRKALITFSPRTKTLTAKSRAHRARMAMESFLPNWSRLTCKGVFFSEVDLSSAAILPISVCIPVPVTRKRPRP